MMNRVVSAMLTYRADISADMMNAYSKAGVIHIMSVSGLHVGVIYIMITAVVGLFAGSKRKWLNIVIAVTLICSMRSSRGFRHRYCSATMIVCCYRNRHTAQHKPFNSLAAAALYLIAFNPQYWRNWVSAFLYGSSRNFIIPKAFI